MTTIPARSKTAFISGTITDNPLTDVATTLNSANLANLPAIAAPTIAAIVLDPTGVGGAPEVVWVTAHTGSATSATIVRGREGTTGRQHASGIAWVHGSTITDIEEEPAYAVERMLDGTGAIRHLAEFVPSGDTINTSVLGGAVPYVGKGWRAFVNNSGVISDLGTSPYGVANFSAGATSGSSVLIAGGSLIYTEDPTLIFRGYIPNEANRSIFMGFGASVLATDGNNRIGFRILTSGNIVGISDSAGTETTRDTGAVPDNVLTTLKVVVSSGGTIVRLYKDGVQVGADITTNIPTVAMYPTVAIINTTTADKVMKVAGAAYWREM